MSELSKYGGDARPYDVPAYGTPPSSHTPAYGASPYGAAQYGAPRPGAMVAVTDAVAPNLAVVVIAWVCVCFTGFYMLPWAIAATRGTATRWGTFWVNLLLGWTFVGWIIALVMACRRHRLVGYAPLVVVADR